MRLARCEQDRRLLAILPDINIDRIGVAAAAGMFAEGLSAELRPFAIDTAQLDRALLGL
jgi:hypothetical protein